MHNCLALLEDLKLKIGCHDGATWHNWVYPLDYQFDLTCVLISLWRYLIPLLLCVCGSGHVPRLGKLVAVMVYSSSGEHTPGLAGAELGLFLSIKVNYIFGYQHLTLCLTSLWVYWNFCPLCTHGLGQNCTARSVQSHKEGLRALCSAGEEEPEEFLAWNSYQRMFCDILELSD